MSGSEIGLPASACSTVITLRMWASGFLAAVGVILHRDGGQVLARGAVLMHVTAGDHREQGREGGAGASFAAAIARPGQDFGDPGRRLRGHLLDARRPGRRRTGRRRRPRTAWKKAEPLEAQAASKRVQGTPVMPISPADVGRQVVLADERRSGEVPEIERLDLGGTNLRIRKGFVGRLDGQGTKIAVREGAERRLADSDDGYRPHITLRIAPKHREPPQRFPAPLRHVYLRQWLEPIQYWRHGRSGAR